MNALPVRNESTYINLFHTRQNESINDDENDEIHTSTSCPTRLVYITVTS